MLPPPEKLVKWSFFERKLKIEIFMIGWMKSWKERQRSKWQERLQAHVLPLLMITNVLRLFMAFEASLSILSRLRADRRFQHEKQPETASKELAMNV